MPQADEGSRVRLKYICRLEDGTVYDFADRDILEFVVGEGDVFPELEKAVIGMNPGDSKKVRIPADEVSEFPYQQEPAAGSKRFPAGTTGIRGQYNIAPGEEGDVLEELVPPPPMHIEKEKPEHKRAGQDLIFDIELIDVEEVAELEL